MRQIIIPEDQFELEKLKLRFFSKVEKTNNCWNWTAFKNPNGYGLIGWGYREAVLAHRLSYELFKGSLSKDLTIDHLCRNHSCVNPEHLEAVTDKENVLRGKGPTAINSKKTHCIHGHEFTLENTYIRPIGNRDCRVCMKIRVDKHYIKIGIGIKK